MQRDEPGWVAAILQSGAFWLLARLIVSFMFWITGLEWLLSPSKAAGAAGMVGFGAPAFWGWVLIAFYMLGSLAIVLDRWLWLATGAFAGFTVLAILLVHPVWSFPPAERAAQWLVVKEHITVIGGLMCAAIASHFRRARLA